MISQFLWIAILIGICLSLGGCSQNDIEPNWIGVQDFLYQLQRAHPDRIGETAFDLVVVSYSATGSSPEVIPNLKHSPSGPKIVLCYMSIGQAERYRWYYQPDWGQNPPEWMGEPDPVWGDRWVEYWHPEWQSIIYGTPESYLDKIIEMGFDGVYLDRVDAYQYFQDEHGHESAAREMVDFVLDFTEYARKKKPGFGVFPQNAEELGIQFHEFMDAMTGMGVEDLYYGYPQEHQPSPAHWTAEREAILDQWVAAGKLVLTIDYSGRPEQIADAYARALEHGYVPYVTDRSLGRLRINEGFEPDKDPSEWNLP